VSGPRCRAVLFDMDGTLVHTAPDIAAALNVSLYKNGIEPLSAEQITDLVGKGIRITVQRVLATRGVYDDEALLTRVLDDYVHLYAERSGRDSHIFPGAIECLRELRARGIKLAVVTNARQLSAEATLARFSLTNYFDAIVGGDRAPTPKPHPALLLVAFAELGVAASEALMVGDSANDVEAARAAGCRVVCVPHGYNEGRPVVELRCPIIARLQDLPAWIETVLPALPTTN
jgi:phosphoglycolate phosphatase